MAKQVDPSSRICESSIVSDGVLIEENCTVKGSSLGPGTILRERVSLKRVEIGGECLVNCGTYIENATIEDGVFIAPNCSIVGVTHDFSAVDGVEPENVFDPIYIAKKVFIGAGTVVLPGVRIGACSVIGAGSVVDMAIPPGHTYVGTPLNYRLFPTKPKAKKQEKEKP